MSVQMPQRPEGRKPNGSSEVSSIRPGAASAHTVTITDRASGSAAQLSLSRTAKLADSFNIRQSEQARASSLLRTHAVLDASHSALQRESRIYDRQA